MPLPWPAVEALPLKFVAHHLWDPAKREADERRGMPANVGDASRTGRPCTSGEGSRAHSPPLPSARLFGSPYAPPGIPAHGRVSAPLHATFSIGSPPPAAPTNSSTSAISRS
jgi:hypothetical protein